MTFYSLLFDYNPLVKAWAINSLAQIGINKFHHSIALSILKKLNEMAQNDSLKESLIATAYAIKLLLKEEVSLTSEIGDIVRRIENSLRESKYFSVRNELIS